jgi:flagellar biosynthesis protein FliR
MLILKIIAVVLLLAGFGTALEAKYLVKKFNTVQNTKVTFEHEMDEKELEEYKLTKAMVNMKMCGLLIALPGIILTLVAFK